MEKIVIRRPGGFRRLEIESLPDPTPGDNDVLVQTRAIGVNYADCVVRMGYYASAKEFVGWPVTPGFEFSGTVSAVGEKVTDLAAGQEVFGLTRFGAYATHVVVPRRQVYLLPPNVTLEEAGAFPVVFLTAFYALHMVVHIHNESTILVHSAAGGVGSALLQLCRLAGWRSIGVVGSTHKVEAARAMGADFVIDKSNERLWEKVEQYAPEGLDVVLDGNGATTLRQGYNHLRPTGKLISYGFHSMFPRGRGVANPIKLAWDYLRTPRFNPVDLHKQNKTLVTFNLSFLFDRDDLLEEAMRSLCTWLSEGKIHTPNITTYPFRDVARAHQDLQSGTTVGKLVLIP